jgi:hypothetical protein
MRGSLRDRFNAKWMPEPNSGCWIWLGAMSGLRPSMGTVPGTQELAYRVSWQLHRGEIPCGLYVCHHCDVPLCVNPDHLFLGTQADNLADMSNKGRGRGPCRDRANTHYKTKLTEADVVAIRADPRPTRAVGRDYGVTQANISAVRSGKTWRHVL